MNVVNSVLGTGIWREVRIVVIVFTASALVRLLPLPRQDRGRADSRHARHWVLGVMAGIIGAAVLASCALDIAHRRAVPRPSQVGLTVVDGSTVAASLRPGVGVFVVGATISYRPVNAWAKLTGARPGLVTYYTGWGDPCQTRFARWAHKRGAVPFVQMNHRSQCCQYRARCV